MPRLDTLGLANDTIPSNILLIPQLREVYISNSTQHTQDNCSQPHRSHQTPKGEHLAPLRIQFAGDLGTCLLRKDYLLPGSNKRNVRLPVLRDASRNWSDISKTWLFPGIRTSSPVPQNFSQMVMLAVEFWELEVHTPGNGPSWEMPALQSHRAG